VALYIIYPNCSLFTFGQSNDSYSCDTVSPFAFVPVWYAGLIGQVGLVDSMEVFDMIGISNRRLCLELVCYFQG
jgi:hypothetical protein